MQTKAPFSVTYLNLKTLVAIVVHVVPNAIVLHERRCMARRSPAQPDQAALSQCFRRLADARDESSLDDCNARHRKQSQRNASLW